VNVAGFPPYAGDFLPCAAAFTMAELSGAGLERREEAKSRVHS
jgi:hypothetical protein